MAVSCEYYGSQICTSMTTKNSRGIGLEIAAVTLVPSDNPRVHLHPPPLHPSRHHARRHPRSLLYIIQKRHHWYAQANHFLNDTHITPLTEPWRGSGDLMLKGRANLG